MQISGSLKKFLSLFLVWLFSLSIGLYFRTYPLRRFSPNDSTEKASVYVIANLKHNAYQQIDQQYPGMAENKKQLLTKELFEKIIKNDSKKVQKSIEKVAEELTQQNPSLRKHPYLLASDSFYYYDLTKQIKKTGSISDTIKGSKYLNKKMLAPEGHWEPLNLHPYVGYSLYALWRIFDPQVSLMYAVSYTPLVLTALILIAYILLCRLLGYETIFIFIGSVFFILIRIFAKRSMFGWYDNDPYNILFPLLILSSLFFGIKKLYCGKTTGHATFLKNIPAVFWSLVTALLITAYAFFWQGWVFFFSILCGGAVAFISSIYIFRVKDNAGLRFLPFFSLFIGLSFIFIAIVFGGHEFFTLFNEGWTALTNFLNPQLSQWPDLYLTVSELKKASLGRILEICGGYLFFLTALTGAVMSLLRAVVKKDLLKLAQVVFLEIFLIGSIFITFGAERFAILCLIPLSLFFPYGLKIIYGLLSPYGQKFRSKKFKTTFRYALMTLLVSSILIPIYTTSQTLPEMLNRIYNDTWDEALKKIKLETPQDSIVTSWWPPGHFIKATAQRRVTFDGATINVPQGYWIANMFLSQDENEALGILRMLNTSANNAAEYLEKLGLKVSDSVTILKNITKVNRTQADQFLSEGINNPDIREHILDMTHGLPPASYILLYKEFVDNNLQLAFIGRWNFKRIEEINADPKLLSKVPRKNLRQYTDFLWTLSGGPLKYSQTFTQINRQGNELFFPENIRINLNTKSCRIDSPKFGNGTPISIFYLNNNQSVREKTFKDANLPFSILLFQEGKYYSIILMDRSLANSFLMKLFFFDAKGLKHTHLFFKNSDLTKRTEISIFKIDWNSYIAGLKKNPAQ